jgi:hypothetical protein
MSTRIDTFRPPPSSQPSPSKGEGVESWEPFSEGSRSSLLRSYSVQPRAGSASALTATPLTLLSLFSTLRT